MTRKEALKSAVGFDVDDSVLNKALIDGGFLIEDDEDYDVDTDKYSKEISKSIDLCAMSVLETLLSMPDVTEGGLSLKFDRDAISSRLEALSKKYNLSNPASAKVSNASNRW